MGTPHGGTPPLAQRHAPIVGTNREVFKLITLTDVRLKPSTEATGDVHLLPLTFEEARVMKGYVAGR